MEFDDHDYDVLPVDLPLSSLTINIVTYMSGFVVKMLQKSLKCPKCILMCTLSKDDALHLSLLRFGYGISNLLTAQLRELQKYYL
ncbi:hypothetical protein ABEB36_009626 [Hypothenemus hampei]|uniref:Uncharacterized protein n=1 Tax=Hypothenemus hampei TaxID=57062 RepID=A0ABD1EGW9_HYPHA